MRGVLAVVILVAVVLAIVRRSWALVVLTLGTLVVSVLCAGLASYLGFNWVLNEAERAFFEESAVVMSAIRELGIFLVSTAQPWTNSSKGFGLKSASDGDSAVHVGG